MYQSLHHDRTEKQKPEGSFRSGIVISNECPIPQCLIGATFLPSHEYAYWEFTARNPEEVRHPRAQPLLEGMQYKLKMVLITGKK